MANQTVSQEKDKPVFDEETLAKLLEAAYVLQEHNAAKREREHAPEPEPVRSPGAAPSGAPRSETGATTTNANPAQDDYSAALSRIVDTQRLIQIWHLDLTNALELVAERVVEIGRARGTAVGLISGQDLEYAAVLGMGAPARGSKVAVDQALSESCINTGQVFRCPDVNSKSLTDSEQCCRRGIQSFIAVPIFRQGEVSGALELYYDTPDGFSEHDVHSCQLMAGLVTEALGRDVERTRKSSIASERAAMLDVLEKIQPNLAALVGQNSTAETGAKRESPAAAAPAVRNYTCRKCGHSLVGGEMFCGQCGSPRNTDYEPPSMQSKVAALWEMQEAKRKHTGPEPTNGQFPVGINYASRTEGGATEEQAEKDPFRNSLAHGLEEAPLRLLRESDLPGSETTLPSEVLASLGLEEEKIEEIEEEEETEPSEKEISVEEPENQNSPSDPGLAAQPSKPADWSSAASARQFLEQLASSKRSGWFVQFWNTRRGDIYLAIAIILVLCVIRWGVWPNRSPDVHPAANAAVAAHRKPAGPELSVLDRMLIQLGLAEAPPVPEDRGNPAAQVWVDLKTGLYYCAGADLYGKTPKGKLTTQRDAQLDQFEPAYRKPCN